jgi:hypothetical protein
VYRSGTHLFLSHAPCPYVERGPIVSARRDSTRLLELEQWVVKQKLCRFETRMPPKTLAKHYRRRRSTRNMKVGPLIREHRPLAVSAPMTVAVSWELRHRLLAAMIRPANNHVRLFLSSLVPLSRFLAGLSCLVRLDLPSRPALDRRRTASITERSVLDSNDRSAPLSM